MPAKKILIALAVVVVAGALGGYYYLQVQQRPGTTAGNYLEAWEAADYEAMQELLIGEPARFAELFASIPEDLGASDYSFELGEVTEQGITSVAAFEARWQLGELGELTYGTELQLERTEGEWRVVWSPAAVHPDFTVNSTFQRTRSWPERGRLLAFDGQPITEYQSIVAVGIEPRRITDREAMIQALVDNLGVDGAAVNAALDRPEVRPDWFVPVVEISRERFEQLRPIIYPVPGLVFQSRQVRLPPSEDFALNVIGTVAEATAEQLEELGAPYRTGDQVGQTGLEQVFERRLAGTPTLELLLRTPGADDEVLLRRDGEPSRDVPITLSLPVQTAAEAAMEGIEGSSALVVLDTATGDVRAAVSRPLGEFNRAFGGRYPPGSAFKVVSAATLLGSGVSVDQEVPCPEEIEVGGRTFGNFEGEALGTTTFEQVFVHSCNTGFIGLTAGMDAEQLIEGAERFGFGAEFDFPLNVAGALFPEPVDATEKAAATIGQGRVLASPLHMATVAAAVSSGQWRPPRLLTSDEPGEPRALEPAVRDRLEELMIGVVQEGTGQAAQVAGATVAGKTGTAEFGDQDPPQTHAWFIGFSGDYAFAVLVEGGGVGGEVAAPIAARLIGAL